MSKKQLLIAEGCSRCCSRSRGQEELGGIYLSATQGMLLPHIFPSQSQTGITAGSTHPCWAEAQGATCPNPPASSRFVSGSCSSGLEPHHPPGPAEPSHSIPCPHLHVLPPGALFVCWLSELRPAGKPLLSKYCFISEQQLAVAHQILIQTQLLLNKVFFKGVGARTHLLGSSLLASPWLCPGKTKGQQQGKTPGPVPPAFSTFPTQL